MLKSIADHSFEFQFHKGTIRTTEHLGASTLAHDFNSIKVRLEHYLPASEPGNHAISIP